MKHLTLITPNWDAPQRVLAFTTTRHARHGASAYPKNSFNLALHVGDDETNVVCNRELLLREISDRTSLKTLTMRWLNQTHSDILVDDNSWQEGITADAVMTSTVGEVCLVMTADCLPVVIVNEHSQQVAVLHCGWKGLYQMLISKVIKQFEQPVNVWLAPAISQVNYEVDTMFFDRFIELSEAYRDAFIANRPGHFLCDLYGLARIELNQLGIDDIYGGEHCTYSDSRFYSHRQHSQTGRQATGVVIF